MRDSKASLSSVPELREAKAAEEMQAVSNRVSVESQRGTTVQKVITLADLDLSDADPIFEATDAGRYENGRTNLPTAEELLMLVQSPEEIFEMAKHTFCCFGVSVMKAASESPKASPKNFQNYKRISMTTRGVIAKRSSNNGVPALMEPEYSEKNLEISGRTDADQFRQSLAKRGIAISCRKARKSAPNQDNVLLCQVGDIVLCGVADGHGIDGHWVAHYAVRFVLAMVMPELERSGMIPGDAFLQNVFKITHEAVKLSGQQEHYDLQGSGTTLSLVFVDYKRNDVVSAWCGDSRCTVGRKGPQGIIAANLTEDHKPNDVKEQARIEASGGSVEQPDGPDGPFRIYTKGRQSPGLAMSRSIGDLEAQSVGALHEPDITRFKVTDHYVLCCSDGVWEFLDCKDAAEIISAKSRGEIISAVEDLTDMSRKRWLEEEDYALTDDISAICIYLDH
jgi:serine/threonine protein phosphatase PrpC